MNYPIVTITVITEIILLPVFIYGAALSFESYGHADMLTRFRGKNQPSTASQWYYGDMTGAANSIDYIPMQTSTNFPVGGKLTPGELNVPLEPSIFFILPNSQW